MGHSRFLALLLLSSLLLLSFGGYGFGRVALMDQALENPFTEIVEHDWRRRVVSVTIEDYAEPEPNTNPKNGYIFSPPSPTPAPPPRD